MQTRSIIVTDLTRFTNEKIVCIAGTDTVTGQCIRPMPYIGADECKRLKILPGAILTGEFSPSSKLSGPHQEDEDHKQLRFDGACTSNQFKEALEAGLFNSVAEGFEMSFPADQKHVPLGHKLGRSIITIKVDPRRIDLVEDSYKPGNVKLHLFDNSGRNYRYLPITDFGFHRHAITHHAADDLDGLNTFIHNQKELYVRIGLSRNWSKRPGYWLQVNGIYTFPEFHQEIRSYE